jgi:hypothetical protein
MSKAIIYYHRSYRKITGSGWLFFLSLVAISLSFATVILYSYPFITKHMSIIAQTALSSYYPPETISVIEKSFLWKNISAVSLPQNNPSVFTSSINLIFSLGLILILPGLKRGKLIAIYFFFLAFIHMFSAMFFTFFPKAFPYTATEFSEFYIKSEISIWLFIPIILGMSVMLMPTPIFPKLALILFALIYSFIFGTLRYIIFLFIINEFSTIYMALLFFAFGPLIDFVYIVGIYSFYSSRLARNLKSSEAVWKWSY